MVDRTSAAVLDLEISLLQEKAISSTVHVDTEPPSNINL